MSAISELKKKIEALEKENQELKKLHAEPKKLRKASEHTVSKNVAGKLDLWSFVSNIPHYDAKERNVADLYEQLNFQAALWELMGQAVIITNNKGEVILMNPAAEKLYGWNVEEAIGSNANKIFSSPAMEKKGEEILNNLLQGVGWKGEFLVKNKNGKEFWVEIYDSPIIDNHGQLVGIIGISSDITERKTIEKYLIESEKKYKDLVENSPTGVVILKNNHIVFRNKAFKNLYTISESDTSFTQCLHTEDQIIFESYLQRIKRTVKNYPTNLSLRIGDTKQYKYTEVTCTELENNRNEQVIQIVVNDVSEQVKYKNKSKHLLTDALYLSRKLPRFADIKEQLTALIKLNHLPEETFNPVIKVLNEERNMEQLWSIFQQNFELVFDNFYKKLLLQAPNLTQQELKHCAFIRMLFETKDIAAMFNVKPTTVQINRVRLKKKLGLGSEDDLLHFILTL